MQNPIPDSALLRQLQQRFIKLAGVDDANAPNVRTLIAELFQAQQAGNGVVPIIKLEHQLGVSIADLQSHADKLIGEVDSHAPITVFSPFIAFRRVYLQLLYVSEELCSRTTFSSPTDNALAKISWQFKAGGELNDEQRLAVFSSASLPFTIITGGAGTGKTTTLTKALELILLDHPDADILLAAPTGKAAQRLNESLSAQLDSVDASVRKTLSQLQAKTLHRLLSISERTGRAYQNANNQLRCQVLAIDEASMIGSDLLAQVFDALPRDAKLILLGDANQLPPINAVAFFNDMSRLPLKYTKAFADKVKVAHSLSLKEFKEFDTSIDENAPLANQVCRLGASKRFGEKSVIENCSQAVLNHDADALIKALDDDFHSLKRKSVLYEQLAASYPSERKPLLENLTKRMILCANRQGELGSEAINTHLDPIFRERITCNTGDTYSEWYEGRQILIEKNHFDLHLNNGDMGRCFNQQGKWIIDFGEAGQLPVDLLPNDYSLAFAITIHKSQGSEYDHVDIVLDRLNVEHPNRLITAPLLYTGMTRAKQSVSMFSDETIVHNALSRDEGRGDSPLLHLLINNLIG